MVGDYRPHRAQYSGFAMHAYGAPGARLFRLNRYVFHYQHKLQCPATSVGSAAAGSIIHQRGNALPRFLGSKVHHLAELGDGQSCDQVGGMC